MRDGKKFRHQNYALFMNVNSESDFHFDVKLCSLEHLSIHIPLELNFLEMSRQHETRRTDFISGSVASKARGRSTSVLQTK